MGNPIPSCKYCDQSKCGGLLPDMAEKITTPPFDQLPDNETQYGGNAWFEQEECAQQCAGAFLMQCPPGMTQFAEPAPGISSYAGHLTYYGSFDLTSLTPQLPVGIEGLEYSVMDEVGIPDHLEEG